MTFVVGFLLASFGLSQVYAQTASVPEIDSFHVGENVYARALTIDPHRDSIWVGTSVGALEVDLASHEVKNSFTRDHGLANEYVFAIEVDRLGRGVWFGTWGGGASLFDGEASWTSYGQADGLGAPYELVEKSIQFKSDPATQSGHHATQKQDQELDHVSVAYNPNYVVGLAIDADGVVWAGTWGGGLSRFDGKTWRTFTIRDGLPANHVFMLEIDPEGRLWVGTSEGLARYDGKKFIRYTQQHGLVSNNVFSMAFKPDGGAWVGSYGGVTGFSAGF